LGIAEFLIHQPLAEIGHRFGKLAAPLAVGGKLLGEGHRDFPEKRQ